VVGVKGEEVMLEGEKLVFCCLTAALIHLYYFDL
jgi:hypothetical protein